MAFGYVGDVMFEFVQHVAGKGSYLEFIERVPAGGVHHLGYSVDDYDGATADLLARGYRPVKYPTTWSSCATAGVSRNKLRRRSGSGDAGRNARIDGGAGATRQRSQRRRESHC
jgi:Glyoxalase/Bleomycin resistance protein/Dioxygenase superfamily